jgi:hypothetical protein
MCQSLLISGVVVEAEEGLMHSPVVPAQVADLLKSVSWSVLVM